MKTVFITMADPMTVRNVFRTPFWPAFLAKNTDVNIVILTLPDKKEYYEKIFGGPNVAFEGLDPRWKGNRKADILGAIARSTNKNHTNTWSKMRSYLRGDSSCIATWCKRAYTFLFGNSILIKRLLRKEFLTLHPTKSVSDLFDRYSPCLVISTYCVSFDYDTPINAEAKRRNIQVIGMTRSWDSLSSHGMLRVLPDVLIVQNAFLRESALRYQAVDVNITPIHTIGLPYYDTLKNLSSILEDRTTFFHDLGLDPNKRLILYGAMGDFLFPHEGEIADVFERLIEEKNIEQPAQVIYRAHPKFKSPLEKMRRMKHVIPDRGATYQNSNLASFEIEDADERRLINSIYHADVIVTAGSSFAIDAAAFDKPIICIGFDGTATKVPYWESVQRFYDRYTHFERLVATRGVRIATTPISLAEEINKAIMDPSIDRAGRAKIIELFVDPFDGHASERLEKLLTDAIRTSVDRQK